ncbi:glycosyltransferase [Vibrio toranzoniae]|uniref:glycosyltransferase n=1 Tax=Vibrio toranzoniae TaxID=1194427 RepID=UPI001378AC95|nr:glycosyltransferase [Vibrio toranzoniae]NAZ55356.1 glycosyltransferase [Vibrio toranzoniae]
MKNNLSCVLTVYERTNVEHLNECLLSISNQTYLAEELVIVIDGPIGRKLNEFLIKYKDSENKFTVILDYIKVNQGPANARNRGVSLSNNELVAIMDSDDINRLERFEMQVKRFQQIENLSICGGFISEFELYENDLDSIRRVPLNNNEILKVIKVKSPVNNVTVMLRKSSILAVGGYPNKRTSEDYELWVKLYSAGYVFSNIDKVLVDVRFEYINLTNRNGYKVFKDDLSTQLLLTKTKITSKFEFALNCFRYLTFRLVPRKVKILLMKNILRKRV